MLAAGLLVGSIGASAGAASADDVDGIGITVTVSPAPVPSSTSTPSASPGGSSTVVTGGDTPAPSSTPEPGEANLEGIVFVSGLRTDARWTPNPLATEATLTFTVRNASNSRFNSTARFWIDGPLGSRLGESHTVYIVNLKPNETRVVETTIGGLGQWAFLHGHVTYNPPREVDGIALEPVMRDQYFFVLPWVLAILGVIGAAAYVIVYLLRRDLGLVPAGQLP